MAKEELTVFHPLIMNFGSALPAVSRNYPPNSFFLVTSAGTTQLYVMNAAGTTWVNVPLSASTGVASVAASAPITSTGGANPVIAWNPSAAVPFNNQQLTGAVIENANPDPTSGVVAGRLYYNTGINGLKFYNGTGWSNVLTDLTAGTGITIGGTGNTRSVTLSNTGVVAGSYTLVNLTVNAQGQITAISNGSATFLTGVTGSNPIFVSGTAPSQNISLAATVGNSGGTTVTQTANSASSNQGGVVHQQGYVSNGVVLDQIMTGSSITPPGVNGILTQGDRGYNPTTRAAYSYNNTVGTTGWYQTNEPAFLGGFPASPPTYMRVYRNEYRVYFTYDGSAWQQDTIPSYSGSFPASTFTGFRVYRTDRNLEYYYDGTRWLSTTLFPFTLSIFSGITIPLTATTPGIVKSAMPHENYPIYLDHLVLGVVQNLTLTSSDNWDITLYGLNSSLSTATSIVTFNTFTYTSAVTGTRVAGNYYLYPPTVGSVLTPGYSAGNYVRLRLDATKNGSSGTTLAVDSAAMHYRLVG